MSARLSQPEPEDIVSRVAAVNVDTATFPPHLERVLIQLARGNGSLRGLSKALGITQGTARMYLHRLRAMTGVRTKIQLAILADKRWGGIKLWLGYGI